MQEISARQQSQHGCTTEVTTAVNVNTQEESPQQDVRHDVARNRHNVRDQQKAELSTLRLPSLYSSILILFSFNSLASFQQIATDNWQSLWHVQLPHLLLHLSHIDLESDVCFTLCVIARNDTVIHSFTLTHLLGQQLTFAPSGNTMIMIMTMTTLVGDENNRGQSSDPRGMSEVKRR